MTVIPVPVIVLTAAHCLYNVFLSHISSKKVSGCVSRASFFQVLSAHTLVFPTLGQSAYLLLRCRTRHPLFSKCSRHELLYLFQHLPNEDALSMKNIICICLTFQETAIMSQPMHDHVPSKDHLHLSCSRKQTSIQNA